MFVISVYGRAGQGAETAVSMLAKAAFSSQMGAQALFFPSQERNVSPVFGQVKIDKGPILSRQVESYDMALVLDKGLDLGGIISAGKEGSSLILNSDEKIVNATMKKKKMKSYSLNATDIALRNTGRHIPNIAMVGAVPKLYGKLQLRGVKALVEQSKEQAAALEEGYRSVK